MTSLDGNGLVNALHVVKSFTHQAKKSTLRTDYIIQEISVVEDTDDK